MAKRSDPPSVRVIVTVVGARLVANVMVDGAAPDYAGVQWERRTPWRAAEGGRADMIHRGPGAVMSQAARVDPPEPYVVTARVPVGEDYVYSEAVEVSV
jgi:hypothetical protein